MANGTSKTARFYQQNPESAQHHSDTNNSAHPKNKFAHSKKYKRDHMAARRHLKIRKGMDYEKNTGRARNRAANRADHT